MLTFLSHSGRACRRKQTMRGVWMCGASTEVQGGQSPSRGSGGRRLPDAGTLPTLLLQLKQFAEQVI